MSTNTKAQAQKRKKALQQAIEALGNMETSLKESLRVEEKAGSSGVRTPQ